MSADVGAVRQALAESGPAPDQAPERTEAARVHAPPPATIVPPQSVAGRALTLVVAIMSFLACLTVGAVALVSEAVRSWQADLAAEVTIQVKPMAGSDMPRVIERAMQLARETPGVERVRLLSERDTTKLLEPWLGGGVDFGSLPVPRLIVVGLGHAGARDLAGLKTRLAAEVAGASLDDHRVWTDQLRRVANAFVVLGLVVLVLVLAAMSLCAVFATRAAMAGNRVVIEVLHLVGAEDSFIARQFQRHFLLLGLRGGAIGGLAAMALFLALAWIGGGPRRSDEMHALFGDFAVGSSGYLGAILVVGIVAALTAVTSRITVQRYLGDLD